MCTGNTANTAVDTAVNAAVNTAANTVVNRVKKHMPRGICQILNRTERALHMVKNGIQWGGLGRWWRGGGGGVGEGFSHYINVGDLLFSRP